MSPYLRHFCHSRADQPDLEALTLEQDDLDFLREACPFLKLAYLEFLWTLHLEPKKHVFLDFDHDEGTEDSEELGALRLVVKHGLR